MDRTDHKYFLLTFDVEDWFQVENFKSCIPYSSWSSCELRVERNVHRILDLLDSVSMESKVASRESQADPLSSPDALNPSRSHNGILLPSLSGKSYELSAIQPKATFFVLGWIAERLPHLVREIDDRGHEVASHGYNHRLCYQCSDNELRDDLIKSKKVLEGLVGKMVIGYRAPSFSVNHHLISLLEEAGYQYDSSFNSFGGNSRYGELILPKKRDKGLAYRLTNNVYELPISNLVVSNFVIPIGGGGYFRLIPFPLFTKGVRAILKRQKSYLFYLHPWEIDPEQPRVQEASSQFKFRHYHNLRETEKRLFMLIRNFNDCYFVTCGQYLNENKN